MLLVQVFLFVCLFILFYSYAGYYLLLWVIVHLRGKKKVPLIQSDKDLPKICLIIAAYNEAPILETKILNSLSLEYPPEKRRIIFVTDGSTDESLEILTRYPGIINLHEPLRKGKIAAMHRAVGQVTEEILIFSDANTVLNPRALLEISKHYQDPLTGGVAGEKKVKVPGDHDASSSEGLYWKYESSLKRMDSELYSVVGAAGEIFSVRSALYEYPGNEVILDDFIISLRVCQKGFRVAYEPNAVATENPSNSLTDESKRKTRISAGAFQSMIMLRGLMNFFKHPLLSFQYTSHRVLRWAVCPFLFPLAFIFNVIIMMQSHSLVYDILLTGQILFYMCALTGWYLSLHKIKISAFYAVYYLAFMNICLYKGLGKFLKKEQTVLWDKASRNLVEPV